MATRVRLFDSLGIQLTELSCQVRCGWTLDGMGTATLVLGKSDSKATEPNLRYGNLVLVEHGSEDGFDLGRWGGEIWTTRAWHQGTIQITARTIENRLKYRRTSTASVTGTAGDIFTTLINDANTTEDTRIELGTVYDGGSSWTETTDEDDFLTILERIAARSGQDWSIEPAIASNGRLYFIAQWHQARGSTYTKTFVEGQHFQAPGESAILIEQGEIYNDILFVPFSDGGTGTTAQVEDTASISLHRRRQARISAALPTSFTAATYAALLLAQYKQPRRTVELRLINQRDNLTYCGLGDSFTARLVENGFTDEARGLDVQVRVLSKEFAEPDGFMTLVVNEVVA